MAEPAKNLKATFRVNYFCKFGENVAVVGNVPALGEWNPLHAKKLEYKGDGNWAVDVNLALHTHALEYHYILSRADGSFVWEGGAKRVLEIPSVKSLPSILLDDQWKSFQSEEMLPHVKASLFSEVVYGRNNQSSTASKAVSSDLLKSSTIDFTKNVLVNIRVYSVFIKPSHSLRISGNIPELGNWSAAKSPKFSDSKFPVWEVEFVVPKTSIPFDYKLVACNDSASECVWEDGPNRHFTLSHRNAIFTELEKFKHHHEFRGAGVAIPVFSLRSKSGLGVGEFADIKKLVDWAVTCGIKLIQLLPVNDTWSRGDWRDSYPYSSISVYALHPIYLDLKQLTNDTEIVKLIESKATELNKLHKIDYEAVLFFKMDILRKIFEKEKSKFVENKDFNTWLFNNSHWLPGYALFSTLRDKHKTSDYSLWPELNHPSHEQLTQLTSSQSPYYNSVLFYFYIQYQLHLQLQDAAKYAASHKVGIKGDIAIGVSPKGVETWIAPHLFRLDKSTGAPPDAFSADGQNWGFPTYNWDEMAKDDYTWWRQRLTHMAQYFHAFRIDHILGFFRIWEIPTHAVTGLLGRFQPSLPIWRNELESRGFWDLDRLTKPYVRQHLLERFLGEYVNVIPTYFNERGTGIYELKGEYSTEKQIAAALPITGENAEKNFKIKSALWACVQNVVLLQDSEDSNKFYPRIDCMKTTSFAELEGWQQHHIRDLYIDYFYRRQEGLWTDVAYKRLPVMINSTKMLCCGEDLGMVPECVPGVMNNLNILGLRIQRMPGDPKVDFWHPADYPYLTVCTPAVHDTSTLRGWWEEDRSVTQKFWNQILGEWGQAPYFCDEHVTRKIVNQHIYSRSMWSVFAIQDLFGLERKYFEGIDPKEERINEPSNPEHYWRYRMHVNVEDLIADRSFSEKLKTMFEYAGRV